MEHVQPDAIRLPDGTELYTNQDEAMRLFTTPSEVKRYHDLFGSFGMGAQLANMPSSGHGLYKDAPEPLHNRDGRFFWVRYLDE